MFNISWFLNLRVIFFMSTWIIFESLISFSFLYLFKQNKARFIIYYYCILHKQPFADNPACWTHLNLSEIHPQDFHSSVKLFVMFQTHELHKGWEVMYSSIYPPPPTSSPLFFLFASCLRPFPQSGPPPPVQFQSIKPPTSPSVLLS